MNMVGEIGGWQAAAAGPVPMPSVDLFRGVTSRAQRFAIDIRPYRPARLVGNRSVLKARDSRLKPEDSPFPIQPPAGQKTSNGLKTVSPDSKNQAVTLRASP